MGIAGERMVKLGAADHEVTLSTNSACIVEEVSRLTQEDTLQSALEKGARRQREHGLSWITDVLTVT